MKTGEISFQRLEKYCNVCNIIEYFISFQYEAKFNNITVNSLYFFNLYDVCFYFIFINISTSPWNIALETEES